MEEKNKLKIVNFFSFTLKLILVALFVAAVIKKDVVWIISGFIMLIVSLTPFFLKHFLNLPTPWLLDLLVSTALIFHIGAGVFNICEYFPIYNKFTHFFSAAVLAFLFLIVLYIVNRHHDEVMLNKSWIAITLIAFTMAFGVIWEFLEFTTDLVFGLQTQPSLVDTMGDLFADTLGGTFIAMLSFRLIEVDVFKKMTEEINSYIKAIING
ncbi:MAG: hypothetical protein V5A64_06320 [Candidatus Thermoplasmatota archaeon]